MKTEPMLHQIEARNLLIANPDYFALAAEQGTGKTWMLLDEAERRFLDKEITGLLVIAPKGVHVNWIKREAPAHLSCAWKGLAWKAGGTGKKFNNQLQELNINAARLAIFAINIDALNTLAGYNACMNFLQAHKSLMVVDESQKIKTHTAGRTKRTTQLGKFAKARRIASGTMVTQGPQDLFSQFQFLRPGLLGTNSFRAYISEYAELLPDDHPLIAAASRRPGVHPIIVKKDFKGRPIYKNMDKLHRLISPMMYRIRKQDCLDLPEKIYQTHYFDLNADNMRAYRDLQAQLAYQFKDGHIDTFTAMTVLTKLRQVSSGYILREGQPSTIEDGDARINAMCEVIEDMEGQVIIWASFRHEIHRICDYFDQQGYSYVEYHGGVSPKDRESAIDDFQSGKAKYFVANPAAGGVGITLTAANGVVYYSNSPSLESRLQSEDRCHRIGTKANVLYVDLVANDTIDEKLAAALQTKKFVAEEIIDGAF